MTAAAGEGSTLRRLCLDKGMGLDGGAIKEKDSPPEAR